MLFKINSFLDSLTLQGLDAASVTVQSLLTNLANNDNFISLIKQAFGDNFDEGKAEQLRQEWANGDFTSLPEIEIRGSEEINGALGAFSSDTNRIYLSQGLINNNRENSEPIVSVLLAEVGHFVDSKINITDAVGDEGDIFSALALGKSLTESQLQQFKSENDQATITLDGQVIEIEQASVSDGGGFEGSEETLTLDSKGGVTLKYSYEHYTIPDNFMIRYEGKNLLETGFVGGSKSGTVKVPKGNSNQVQVIVATDNEGTAWYYNVTNIEISVEDSWIEVNNTETVIKFKVSLSQASDQQVTVDYSTLDGTATSLEKDYEKVSNKQLIFEPGETTKEISIKVLSDAAVDANGSQKNFEIFARDTAYRNWNKKEDIDYGLYEDLGYRVNDEWGDSSSGFQAFGLTSDEIFFLVLSNPQNASITNDPIQKEKDLIKKIEDVLPEKPNEQDSKIVKEARTEIQNLQSNQTPWTFATGKIYDTGKDPVLAIRGTFPTNGDFFKDIFTDLNSQGVGFDQYQNNRNSIETWLEKVSKQENGEVSFRPHITGHSLGGALTQWVATNYSEQLGQIVTFNSPGISSQAANFNVGKTEGVTHYITTGDVVSMAGEQFISGNVVLSSYSKLLSVLTFETHSVPVINSFIKRTELSKPNLTTSNISSNQLSNGLFTYHPDIASYDLDWDYFVLQLALATLDPKLALKLNYRADVEDTRQLIGQKVEEAFKLRDKLANGGKLILNDFDLKLAGLLDVKAQGLVMEYVKQPEESLKLQGKIILPTIYNVTADISGSNFIKIRNPNPPDKLGIDIVGKLLADDIKIVPNVWEIKKAEISLDTTVKEIKGKGTILIPTGIELSGELGFLKDELNVISLDVDKINKPIDATGLFLQRIKGKIENIAEDDPDPTEFTGGVGISGGPKISVSLPSWAGGGFSASLIDLDVTGTISSERLQASGDIKIIGGLINGFGNHELNWDKGFFKSTASFSALDGLITTNSSFTATSQLNIAMGGAATVNIPNFVPLFGGKQLSSGKYTVQFTNDGNYSNDFIAGWGTISIPIYGSFTKGIKVYLDGNYEIIGSQNIPQTNSFAVTPNTPSIIVGAEWENSNNNVRVRIKTPDGNFIEEADFATYNITIVNELTDSRTRTVVIGNPNPGIWDIEVVSNQDLGNVEYSAFQNSVAPTIELTSPSFDILGTEVLISWNAFDSDSDAKISLFYDTDNQDFDGILITDNLYETDGRGNFVWNPQGLATGEYFIYAMILDENNPPVFSYSQGKLIIVEEADLSVVQTNSTPLVTVADNFTYTVTVTNNGLAESKNVILTETLPEETPFVLANLTPSSYSGNILTFELGNLAPGESQEVNITVTAPSTGGTLTAISQIGSNTFDPNYSNNLDRLNITVAPLITINDVVISEIDESAVFTVNLNTSTTETITVNYTTANNTATYGADYTANSGILLFAPGETQKTISVEISADTEIEDDETFWVNISSPSKAVISDGQGLGTIQNSPSADLSILQTTQLSSVNIGQNFIYRITVTNNSSVVSQGVTLVETLPDEVTFVTSTLNPAQQIGNNLTFNIGDLAGGENKTIEITVTAPSTPSIITTNALIYSDTFDTYEANNAFTLSTPVLLPQPDLVVTRTDNIGEVSLGETFAYTLTVTNNGSSQATNVVLTEKLPSGVDFINATNTQGNFFYDSYSNQLTANLDTLDVGKSTTVTLTLSSIVAGNLISTSNVISDQTDANPFNNSLVSVTTINPTIPDPADLELTQTVNNLNPKLGDSITFTLTLTNKGPGIASGIKVTDLLPPELTFINSYAAQGTYDSNTGIWDVGNIRDNGSRTLTIVAQVNAPGSITSTAEITAVNETDPDSTPGNHNPNEDDQASVTIATPLPVDLSVRRTDTPASVLVGDTYTYALTVTNTNSQDASNVILTENLPSGLDLVSVKVGNFVDLIKFQLNAGATATIDVDAGEFASKLDPVLRIFNSVGNQVAFNDDNPAPGEGFSFDPYIEFTAPTTDTYYVGVSSFANIDYNPFLGEGNKSSSTSDEYDIIINVGGGSGTPAIVPLTQPNNIISEAFDSGLNSSTPATFVGRGLLGPAKDAQVQINNGVITANLGNLKSNESQFVYVTVTPIESGEVVTTTNVTSNEPDLNPSDNSLTNQKTIGSVSLTSADLELTQTVDKLNPQIEDFINITLTLTNKGPGAASRVKVTDFLPQQLGFISANANQGTYFANTGEWNVGQLGNGLSASLTLKAKVILSGDITNTASVAKSDQPDPDSTPGNNNANEDDQTTVTLTILSTQGTDNNDVLTGTSNNEVFAGGLGVDVLTGGGGSDIFVYHSFRDRGDRITDFSPADDRLDLSEIFASTSYGSTTPFSSYLRFVQLGTNTDVQINPVGDSRNILRSLVTLENVTAADLTVSNFIL